MSDKLLTTVKEYPKCDFCGKEAYFDAKTQLGPWAFMCEEHFKQYGIRLGTGYGQMLVKEDDKK